MSSNDKFRELGGGPLDCFRDSKVCFDVTCCCGGGLGHWIDAAARFNLWPPAENVHQATRCCGCCAMCYAATVEVEINKRLGGSGDDWWTRCLCMYCCPQCKSCQIIRVMTNAYDKNMVAAGQPMTVGMKR